MNKADCIFELKQIRGVYAGMRKGYRSCVEALGMAINALEQTAWIPCGERLPEMGKRVLICGKKGGIAIARRAKYLEEFKGWTFWMQGGKPMEAIAWMPLPERYGGDEE